MSESRDYQVYVISNPQSHEVYGTGTLAPQTDIREEAYEVNRAVSDITRARASELGMQIAPETGQSYITTPKVEFHSFDSFDEAQEFALTSILSTLHPDAVEDLGRQILHTQGDRVLDDIDQILDE